MHKCMHMPTCGTATVLRTEQRHIEDNKLNIQKVAEQQLQKTKSKTNKKQHNTNF